MVEAHKKCSNLCTVALALFLSVPAVNQIGISLFPSLAGILMTSLYFLSGAVILFFVGMTVYKERYVSAGYLFCVGLIVFLFFVTKLLTEYSEISFRKFSSMTLLAMLCPSINCYDEKKLLTYIIWFSFPAIFLLDRIFTTSGFMYETISMGISYAFLPSVIASVVYLFVYWKKNVSDFTMLIGCLANGVFLSKLVQYGSRGPTLSVVLCVLFLVIYKVHNGRGIKAKSWKLVAISFLLAIVIMNIWPILSLILDYIHGLGLRLNFVDKLFRLQSSAMDISNGRGEIWTTVIQEFLKSPLVGYGMSTSFHNIGIIYPHNLVLQLLYDGGLVLALPILYFTIRGFMEWYRNCETSSYALGVMLFFSSIPRAMLSTDVWEHGAVWFTLMYFILWRKTSYLHN